MTSSIHKNLGYDIMQHLHDAIPESSLVYINEYGCYQKLFLNNGCSIHFTKWRQGSVPFYIILYNSKGDYIFELDLSMLIYEHEYFYWHLKIPSNKITLTALQNKFGDQSELDPDYTNLVKSQKLRLKSGKQKPKNGFHFLSNVNWDELTKSLSKLIVSVFNEHNIKVSSIELDEGDSDEGEANLILRRRARKGQRKLRLKLLELYNSKCAITGYSPSEVLEAAHIVNHSISGINHSDNGILLRSDIHSLFDSNLLRINPESLAVIIDPTLKDTPYWKINGVTIHSRTDGSNPSKKYLHQRWGGFVV
jgi:hypothetical protein